jgi:hypothetical protein
MAQCQSRYAATIYTQIDPTQEFNMINVATRRGGEANERDELS